MTALPSTLPGMPLGADGPVFSEPWQAQAFAMVLALHQRGLFAWVEWAQALSERIAEAHASGDADLGDTYYHHWLDTLESLVAAKGASTMKELASHQRAWDHAADRTRHGQPIVLSAQDFAA